MNDACAVGCTKASAAVKAINNYLNPIVNDNSDSNNSGDHSPDTPNNQHQTFSIIIPIRSMNPSVYEREDEDEIGRDPFSFSSGVFPNALKQMLNIFHQMTQQAQRGLMFQRPQNDPADIGSIGGGESNIHESEVSMDSAGNSISVSKSMSVLMTKDKNGHSKMIVLHTIPKVFIHRQSPLGKYFHILFYCPF